MVDYEDLTNLRVEQTLDELEIEQEKKRKEQKFREESQAKFDEYRAYV